MQSHRGQGKHGRLECCEELSFAGLCGLSVVNHHEASGTLTCMGTFQSLYLYFYKYKLIVFMLVCFS